MKTSYVVGFMFNQSMSQVALIRKQKPKWQVGLLNGIGGKIEDGETGLDAIRREFYEETGAQTMRLDWYPFCNMNGQNNDLSAFEIEFFYAFGEHSTLKSQEVEQIEIHVVNQIISGMEKTIGNLPWLVALAIDFGNGTHPPKFVTAQY